MWLTLYRGVQNQTDVAKEPGSLAISVWYLALSQGMTTLGAGRELSQPAANRPWAHSLTLLGMSFPDEAATLTLFHDSENLS